MSVTFWCPDADRQQVPCQFCQGEYVDFPEGNGRGGKCDRFCTGFEEVSAAPEVNLGSENARAILGLLGFDASDCEMSGSCDGATLRQRVFLALNQDLSKALREDVDLEGGHAGVAVVEDDDGMTRIQRMGARYIGFGNTTDQTVRRLRQLEALAVWAQDHKMTITWG